ncbi:hypothetical protein Tco_1491843 [Tanacetum coccineum]
MEEHLRRERKIQRYYEADSKRKKEYGKTAAAYNKEQDEGGKGSSIIKKKASLFDVVAFSASTAVWDHISGKLKKDLQYQAEVSTRTSGKSYSHLDSTNFRVPSSVMLQNLSAKLFQGCPELQEVAVERDWDIDRVDSYCISGPELRIRC